MIIPIPLSRSPYDVHVGAGLLAEAGRLAASVLKPGRCALITDSHVGPLYAKPVEDSLRAAGFDVTTLVSPAGENSKSMAEAASLCERMIAAGLDRSSCVAALGGGVVGDLAGFVAAIYFRGIPFLQIPTTVVAQVDSSVGGKTGVNAPGGKNLIGAFHQPRIVIADTDTLSTLPEREFNEGFAEIIKHAAIRDFSLLDAPDDLPALVARNVAIKAALVAEDEFETRGVRALLNFGHTIGHGIENAAGYGRFLHGEAIALGLVAACRLSVEKSGLAQADCDRILSALARYKLPLALPPDIPAEAVVAALQKDKKFHRGAVRFVLLKRPGEAFVSDAVSQDDILRQVHALRHDLEPGARREFSH
ncbi:MAG: 3-dehydroquinate synthase [Verrucomicrobiae bacterium]